ncbi:MAG: hypothetical protein PVJ63_06500 [Thioalkalispiraceae bacterium]
MHRGKRELIIVRKQQFQSGYLSCYRLLLCLAYGLTLLRVFNTRQPGVGELEINDHLHL